MASRTADRGAFDLRLKAWEKAAIALAAAALAGTVGVLVTDYSIRRALFPMAGEGTLARPIGKVTLAVNSTLRQPSGQPEFARLGQGDPVYPLDTLMAGAGSAMKVTLDDGTVIELGENSMVRLSFLTALQLSGLNRETIVEVVAGTVSGQGTKERQLTIRSQDKVFTATAEKPLVVQRTGERVASAEQKQSVVEDVRAKLAAAASAFQKLGGVMTPNVGTGEGKGPPAGTSLADIYAKMQKAQPVSAPKAVGSGTAGGAVEEEDKQIAQVQKQVLAQAKPAQDLLGREKVKVKTEIAKAIEVEPADNLALRSPRGAKATQLPVTFKWEAIPENAPFRVKIALKGSSEEQSFDVKAKDGQAKLKHVFRKPGTYVWKIEDWGGATLSVRSLHVDARVQSIGIYQPVLIGRERGSRMWTAREQWAFRFRWKPFPGVKDYRIRINRNAEGTAGQVAEKTLNATEFILPFRPEWAAERMFFTVEAKHPDGYDLVSETVPFMFTFLPPKPRLPKDKRAIERLSLVEGAVPLVWEANSDADKFTIEISKDPTFKTTIVSEKLGQNTYRFYPPDSGTYYWHVRGDKDNISSPYSEPWSFEVK